MVVPTSVLPEAPCQVSVQPPAWLPRSSALLPLRISKLDDGSLTVLQLGG